MTNINNNQLPLVEEIQTLKNEIPSWEEFLNNYQVDEKVESSYLAETQAQVLTGPQYGPGNEQSKSVAKKIGSVALAVSYFTPIAPLTITATVGAAGVGVVAMSVGNEEDKRIAEHILDVTVDAGISAVGSSLIPGVGQGSSKVVKTVSTCCKHCPK